MDPTHPWYPAYLPTVSVWKLFSWHCPFKSSFIIEISSLIFSHQLRKCYNLFLFLTDRSRDKASRVGSVSRIRTGGRCGHSATIHPFVFSWYWIVCICMLIRLPPPLFFLHLFDSFFPPTGRHFTILPVFVEKSQTSFSKRIVFLHNCAKTSPFLQMHLHTEREREFARIHFYLQTEFIHRNYLKKYIV